MERSVTAFWRRISLFAVWAVLLGLGGCSTMYVDGSTPEIPAQEFKRPSPQHPVQVVFEFQTKGVSNATATAYLKDRVQAQIRSSGLFSTVSEQPVDGGALLTVTLNNVPLDDAAFSKGFVAGLTFGLVGSKISDGYVCQLNYLRSTGQKLEKKARHAIHTTVGAAAAPGNASKADSADAAISTVVRQVLSQVLNELSKDPSFP